jgi:3-methyladenine DNA glycosylase AlkD
MNSFRKLSNPERAKINAYFFKTGRGEYGEGDQFLGITVPQTRLFAKKHCSALSLKEIEELLSSPWHEERLLALILLTTQYKKSDEPTRTKIYKLYLKHIGKGINNWDLVDTSAAYIVGMHLENKNRNDLYTLAASKNLWKKRVAIIATFYFIRQSDFIDTLKLCELFLSEKHDLMHKACGWMLREVGKKDVETLRTFLKKHAQKMPRTMLRYAIERLSIQEKTLWMKKG